MTLYHLKIIVKTKIKLHYLRIKKFAPLLGEIIHNSQRFDIQLKGSGPTKFSRKGDGLMTLGSAIRELIIGEALHYLKIPAIWERGLNGIFSFNYKKRIALFF
jgi:hypothetical protein